MCLMLQFSYCCHHCYSIVSIARLVFINATLSYHTSPPSFFQSIDNPSLPLLTSSVSQDIGHEKSSFLDDLLATLQTYQMEFDARPLHLISTLTPKFQFLEF
ncbi:hypothetical protein P8452_67260 [Trifolium repens]|nr:hypothetical protein P8452_67260 [Trifolium repens]